MNNITIAGRVGKDAEQRYLPNGDAVLNFSVADDQYKGAAIWWRCSLFGKRAESLAQYLKKGANVTVSGSISERTYTHSSGEDRKSLDIRVNDVALQGSANRSPDASDADEPQRQAPTRTAPPTKRTHGEMKRDARPSLDHLDDDIPF